MPNIFVEKPCYYHVIVSNIKPPRKVHSHVAIARSSQFLCAPGVIGEENSGSSKRTMHGIF